MSEPYEEIVEWWVVDGVEFLRPSGIDLALREAELEDVQDAIAKHDGGAPPSEVREARQLLELDSREDPDPAGVEGRRAEARRVLDEWRRDRFSQHAFLQEKLRLLERLKNDAEEDLAKIPEGAQERRRIFTVRKFSHGEHLDAEDAHTAVDQTRGTRSVDHARLSRDLLQKTLLGERAGGGPEDERLQAPKVDDLDHQVAHVLIQRMWYTNGVTPGMARFFRGGRKAARPGGR